jgi:hypothetical protein
MTAYRTGVTRTGFTVHLTVAANSQIHARVSGETEITARSYFYWLFTWAGMGSFSAKTTTGIGSGKIAPLKIHFELTGAAGEGTPDTITHDFLSSAGASSYALDCAATATLVVSAADLMFEPDPSDVMRRRASQSGVYQQDIDTGVVPAYGSWDGKYPDGAEMAWHTGPIARGRFFWRLAADATITSTITCAGYTASATYTPGVETELQDDFSFEASAYADRVTWDPVSGDMDEIVTITASYDGMPITCDAATHTGSLGSTVSGNTAHAVAYPAVFLSGGKARIFYVGMAPRAVPMSFGIFAMDGDYPDSLTLAVQRRCEYNEWVINDSGDTQWGWHPVIDYLTVGGGASSSTFTQYNFEYQYILDTGGLTTDPASREERCPVWACVAKTSLQALGEDLEDWRCQIRGYQWTAWSAVAQAASYALDGSFSGDGTITLAHGAAPVNGYRYLNIATDQASKPIRVTVNGTLGDGIPGDQGGVTRTWSGKWEGTTGTDGSFVCDLCSPQDATAETDDKDTRWYDVDVDAGYNPPGPYWGPDNLTSIVLDHLAEGTTYTGSTSLERHAHSNLQVCDMLKQGSGSDDGKGWLHVIHYVTASIDSPVTTDVYVRSFLLGDTDGRRSVDTWAISKTIVTTVSETRTVTLTLRALRDLLAELVFADHRFPGWSGALASGTDISDGADGAVVSHGWLNANRPAAWLAGGGLMVSAGTWSHGGIAGLACSSSAGVSAQMLLDEITDWPPGIGDQFGVGGGGSDLQFAIGKVLRGGACGLVSDTSGAVVGSQQVDLLEGATDRGDGTTDATLGEYTTMVPFGKGETSHTVRPHTKTMTVSCSPLRARHWRRACFRQGAPTDYKALAVDSPRSWVHVSDANMVRTFHHASWLPAFVSVPYTAVDSFVGFAVDERKGALYMLGVKD